MKYSPFDTYLIIRKNVLWSTKKEKPDNTLEFIKKEQLGLMYSLVCRKEKLTDPCKACEDKPCYTWIKENAKTFRKVLSDTLNKSLSQGKYNVYINLEKKLHETYGPKIEDLAIRNNRKVLINN